MQHIIREVITREYDKDGKVIKEITNREYEAAPYIPYIPYDPYIPPYEPKTPWYPVITWTSTTKDTDNIRVTL